MAKTSLRKQLEAAEATIAELRAAADSPMKVRPEAALAFRNRTKERGVSIESILSRFRPAQHPPEATPPAGMAMDDNFSGSPWSGGAVGNALTSAYLEGQEFMGYPTLSLMAQRGEYRNICRILASEMTRKWVRVKSKSDDDSKQDKINEIDTFMKRLKVRKAFKRGAELDFYFGRGHLFMEFGGDRGIAKEEVVHSVGNGHDSTTRAKVGPQCPLTRIAPVEPVWVYPLNYDTTDPLSSHWYNPEVWFVMGKQVHGTRLLRFVLEEVSDLLKPAYSFGGLSQTQIAKPYVDNWLRTRQSVSDLVRAFTVFVLKTNMATTLKGGSAEDLYNRLEMFANCRDNNGVLAMDLNTEDLTNVSAPVGTMDHLQAQALEHICVEGGTLVETARGQVPIEEVTAGDLVMTRAGFAPVTWAGQTGFTNRLIRLITGTSQLGVTEAHPVWSETIRDFVPATCVDRSHSLLESPAWVSSASRSPIGGTSGERRVRDTLARASSVPLIDVRTQLCDAVPVYNLRVEEGFLPEFFANGVLIHNCSISRIPLVKYTGITPSGLNASSRDELQAFSETIRGMQEDEFDDNLQVVFHMCQMSLWGEVDDDLETDYLPLAELTELEKAQKRQVDSAVDQVYVEMGAIRGEEVRERLARDPDSLYPGLDVNDMPEAPGLPGMEGEGTDPVGGGGTAGDPSRVRGDPLEALLGLARQPQRQEADPLDGLVALVAQDAEEGTRPKFLKLGDQVRSEHGYAYHVTNEERLHSIAGGSLRTHKPWEFTDQRAWPDGSTRKRSYFASQPSVHFAPEEGKAVVLRTPVGSHIKRESTGDLYAERAIPAHKLEYLHERGHWEPLRTSEKS